MTDALIEKVARAICLNRAAPACKCAADGICKAPAENLLTESNERLSQSRAAILAVLEFYSEPGNVTDSMAYTAWCLHDADDAATKEWETYQKEEIAAAMRAARDEVSRDK